MTESLCRFVLRFRWPVLATLLLVTLFFGYQATKVRVESNTIDLFPSTHPYVETFKKYSDIFGGASRVVIAVEVKDGTIWNQQTLEKVQRITRSVEMLPGVNNYQVLSLAQRKAKTLKIDSTIGFRSVPVMWPFVPTEQSDIDALQQTVLGNRRLYGSLVSLDQKSALVVAGFFENKLDPKVVYAKLDELAKKETDANTAIHMIGRPVLLGEIFEQSPRLGLIMIVTTISMLLVLLIYFRNMVGVLVPTSAAIMSATLGLGFLGLIDQNFDPLVMVIPFIITARTLSHSVQVVSRFLDEHEKIQDSYKAALATSTALFKPGTLAILTDIIGIMLIYVAPIPLLQKLALMGAFWLTSIFFSGMILSPILLSFLPVPPHKKEKKVALVDKVLTWVGSLCAGNTRYVVFAVAGAALVGSFFLANNLVVGDVHPGTPMLWPSSRYNQDTDAIAQRFANTEELTVVVEGDSREAIKRPEVLQNMEAFQREMETLDEVGATSSIADVLPKVIATYHGDDPKWELIPNSKEQSAFFLELIYSSGDPGDLTRFITVDSQKANITLYLRDHKGETLRKVVAHAKKFIEDHPVAGAKFRLAGGYGGLLAAINEEVAIIDAKITLAGFGATFLCCLIAFRSFVAGILFLLPLIISNYMTYALMGASSIGLDVNALPVVALGVGLGVDYGLYVVENVEEAFQRGLSVTESVQAGVQGAGKGVLVTALTMACGLAFWWFSFMRFQAEMGMLLLFWMTMSMLGGLILLPAILVQFKPKFVFAPNKHQQLAPAHAATST
ncbi:MAG TPA: MMPL family transporter [Polyangiales bacterium]|nr:MMPL family transporter [Polyangiales bacterium]